MSHESVALRRSFPFDTTVKLQAAYIRFAIRVAFIWLPVRQRVTFKAAALAWKYLRDAAPRYFGPPALPTSADNVALPAAAVSLPMIAYVRVRLCSNLSISTARTAHSSKPATSACGGWLGEADRQTSDSYTAYYANSGKIGWLARVGSLIRRHQQCHHSYSTLLQTMYLSYTVFEI